MTARGLRLCDPMIQQKFGDATNFMAMVKGGYPAV